MTPLFARILTALGLLRPSVIPPIPLRRALIARHIQETTYPERIAR